MKAPEWNGGPQMEYDKTCFEVPVRFPEPRLWQTDAPSSSFHLPQSPGVASHWRRDPSKNVTLQRPENSHKTCFGQIQVPVRFPEPRLWQTEAPGSSFHLPKSPAVASHWRRDLSQNVKKREKMTHLEKLRAR